MTEVGQAATVFYFSVFFKPVAVGLSPRLELNLGSESEKGKTAHFGICEARGIQLQVPGVFVLIPHMCRFEVGLLLSA